jgi:hypothetical protein
MLSPSTTCAAPTMPTASTAHINASAFHRYLTSGVQLLHARGVRSIGLLLGTPDTAGVQYCDGANTTARRLGMEVTELIRVR